MFACLFLPPFCASLLEPTPDPGVVEMIAREFSPRVEVHRPGLVTLDIDGLGRLLGAPAQIGQELRRTAADRASHPHIAIAATRTAALLLALGRAGVAVIPAGGERRVLAPLPLGVLRQYPLERGTQERLATVLDLLRRWGLKTLGELASLPGPALSERLGQGGMIWQRLARGEELEPLVASEPEAPIEETVELEWPVEGLEPLAFVLARLFEPLCERLAVLDQAAVVLHATFRLASRETTARVLQLPAPMRDPKVLRTLILLHLEAQPLGSGVDRVTIRVETAPARVTQFSLLSRALPFPEKMATLIARLSALLGDSHVGSAVVVDSHRPGAFAMTPFSVAGLPRPSSAWPPAVSGRSDAEVPRVALRRFRLPVAARVQVHEGRPVRVSSDRRGLEGGVVDEATGPWRTSGEWWKVGAGRVEGACPERGHGDGAGRVEGWNRDEWDVALGDGAVYRIYRDRVRDRWFIDGAID
ncbi:MAG TPA: hypothetical protein VGK32_00590 [Vicinamibacterales bacterium]|jgi:protein ImuB